MLRVAIVNQGNAYLPEAPAYERHLVARGVQAAIFRDPRDAVGHDVEVRFMGVHPRWASPTRARVIVHEYNSLSAGRWPGMRDLLKRMLNQRPAGRIFLNELVEERFGFRDATPRLHRDMGVDKSLFLVRSGAADHDLLYCGSVTRPGTREELRRLAGLGLKLLIVGDCSADLRGYLSRSGEVTFTGRMPREALPELYASARAGLNHTPDVFPWNRQTSTKTLEYCAAGLGVVSSRYAWVESFVRQRKTRFLWLADVRSADDFHSFRFPETDVSEFEWDRVLEDCQLLAFLSRLAEASGQGS